MTPRSDDPRQGDTTITHVDAGGRVLAVQQLELSLVEGPKAGTSLTSESDRIAIGSHPRNDLVIDEPTVSRFHCEILVEDHGVRVRDLGSRNGIALDGVPVVEAFLRDGSRLQLGRTALVVHTGRGSVPRSLSTRAEFGDMVGDSVATRELFAVLERAAKADATILLEGETGTGKTLAARSVHLESARRKGPFVIVDCGAIPAQLLESELFGHERGAFTGADAARVGAFEEADGGTLFLDEIAELPLELQPKFLGALEGRTVRRVGSNQMRAVDVRIVAATNRDLRQEVNAGRFRSDLYYRLAVIKVRVPALRERREDLPALARRILSSLGAAAEPVEALMTAELIERLQRATWPGNVRELRNYLERCLVFEEALPLYDSPDELVGAGAADGAGGEVDPRVPYAEARQRVLDGFERRYLTALLALHPRVADAAQAAGIDRTYFYRLLRRHGLRAS
jgi:two-component system, NtrC family, response regulator GlrR